jgi:hypothetical protein
MDFRHYFGKETVFCIQFFKEDEYLFFVENGTYFIRRENMDTSLLKGLPFSCEDFNKLFISLREENLDKLLNN